MTDYNSLTKHLLSTRQYMTIQFSAFMVHIDRKTRNFPNI